MMSESSYIRLLILLVASGFAHAGTWSDLSQAAYAGQALDVQGQYVRQTANGLAAFTVYRSRHDGNVVERRIAADGPPRELLKTRNSVQFYTVSAGGLLQAKMDSIRFFPAMLPSDVRVLKNSYTAKEDKEGRIAGEACRWIWLTPNDADRYTQGFCLDNHNHLPLIQVYKDGEKTVEINSFTRISFQSPSAADIVPGETMTVRDSLQLPPELNRKHLKNNRIDDPYISDLPAGFFILSRRDMVTTPNGSGRHYVIGDGLVNVSLFIESLKADTQVKPGAGVADGALSIAVFAEGDFKITAVGDLPPRSLLLLIKNIRIKAA